MPHWLAWIGLSLVAGGICSAGALLPADLEILLRNSDSSEPISGATLRITSGIDGRDSELQTDENGRASLTAAKPGQYKVQVEAVGHVDPADLQGSGRWFAFTAATDRPFAIWLERSATIEGRVAAESGEPLGIIGVFAFRSVQAGGSTRFLQVGAPAFTDDRGQYRLHSLPAGSYVVMAGSVGGASAVLGLGVGYYPGGSDISRAAMLELAPGTELRAIDIVLAEFRQGSVNGVVTGIPEEWGIHGAAVALLPKSGIQLPVAMGMTDSSGRYQLEAVPTGDYQAVAWGPVVGGAEEEAPRGALARFAEAAVTVGEGEPLGLDLRLTAGVQVEANWMSDRACAGVVSMRMRPDGGWLQGWKFEGRVQNGKVIWDGIPPGTYEFDVPQLQSGCTFVGVQTPGTERPRLAIPIAAPSTLSAVIAPSTGEIAGRREHEGTPIRGVRILLWLESERGLFAEALTDESGEFRLERLPPGSYRIVATPPSGVQDDGRTPVLRPVERRVNLGPGQKLSVHLKSEQGG